jgi:hypothetical protein
MLFSLDNSIDRIAQFSSTSLVSIFSYPNHVLKLMVLLNFDLVNHLRKHFALTASSRRFNGSA